jgi:isopenicillin N synthase-like dioxygenase
LNLDVKLETAMARGGRAWGGYFPVGAELTSGRTDLKEGIYLGTELDESHPQVKAGTPLHGANLFPSTVPGLRTIVVDYCAPVPNAFVCNVGDMLDRITRGRYLSAPHRVQNFGGHDRLSFAFFFDPNFNAEVKPLPLGGEVIDNRDERWDHASVHDFQGTYGDYLLAKVSRVFPELRRELL